MTFRIGDFVRSVVTNRPYKIVGFEQCGLLSAVVLAVSRRGTTYQWGPRRQRMPVDTLIHDEKRRWRN
jgi:hypothetical protein